MSEKEEAFESWEEVIVDFFENRISGSKLFEVRKFIEKKENDIFSEKDEKKKGRQIKARDKKIEELAELRKLAPSTVIRDWLNKITDKNNKRAPIKKSHKISKATHVLKFTHTSSSAGSILYKGKSEDSYLSTSSLKSLTLDFAHNDGALVSISRFLALELSAKSIFDLVLENDFCFLTFFRENKREMDNWQSVFSNLVQEKGIITTDKAKQLYFPLDSSKKYSSLKDIPYHLIIPLFPSSLAQELNQFINYLKYSDEQKNIKKCQKPANEKSSKYHATQLIVVPNIGIQNYGGEYPRNVSMLNANRQGKSYLFSTQPPSWESQLKPPIHKKSLFDNFTSYQISEDVRYLRDFLLRFKHLDLSYKDPKRYAHLVRWVESIIDEVFYYANSIQKLPASWSADTNIKLGIEYQYFLDPYRNDDEFQARRTATDWQSIVCDDFAGWLNHKLAGKEKQFTPKVEHTRIWKKLFEPAIREDCEEIKAEREYNKREAV